MSSTAPTEPAEPKPLQSSEDEAAELQQIERIKAVCLAFQEAWLRTPGIAGPGNIVFKSELDETEFFSFQNCKKQLERHGR